MSFARRHRHLVAAALVVPAVLLLSSCNTRFGANLQRTDDAVVLTGSQLPKLLGAAPRSVVGFAWDGKVWTQVPVQVDERDDVSPGQIYHWDPSKWPKLAGTTTLYKMKVYTPPATTSTGYSSVDTYTPTDSNPNLDADDEVSFLGGDTGVAAAPAVAPPAGVDSASRQQVQVTDPLAAGQVGYVTLFRSTSANLNDSSAGSTGVAYQFQLTSGAYKATYNMGNRSLAPNSAWGFNPETSTVTTPAYSLGFSDRWLNDSMHITQSGASGVDLLDRSMYYVTAGCSRTEDSFDGGDAGEGAFIVNIAGPVRAIRSVLGANSYAYTAKTDVFYPRRQVTTIQLQGHAGLPGYGSAEDLTTGLTGMTYVDPRNPAGLTIDGSTDAFTPTAFTTGTGTPPADPWKMVRGAAGSLLTVATLDTDIAGLAVSTVYQDHTPAANNCTGDANAWGRSGLNVTGMPISVVTDPTIVTNPNRFTTYRTRVFAGPNLSTERAAQTSDQVMHPVQVTVTG